MIENIKREFVSYGNESTYRDDKKQIFDYLSILKHTTNQLVDAVNEMQEMCKSCDDLIGILAKHIAKLQHNNSEKANRQENVQSDTEKHSKPEIPNTAYVTLTEDSCFVGGKPTTQYNGEDIYRPYLCIAYFKEARDIIREEYGFELLELHCLQSSTEGEWAKTGDPVPDKNGTYDWVRAVYKNKEGKTVASRWVFDHDRGSASYCAGYCAYDCGRVQSDSSMRVGLFGSVSQ